MKKYSSILDEIEEELAQQGHKRYKSVLSDNDKIAFGIPDELKPVTKGAQESYSSPVGGDRGLRDKPHTNDKQFSDKNKQLSLPGSSTIQQASYWPTKQYLVVSFKSGHSYSYDSVPIEMMMKWEQASSAGSFFYYNIRMSFRYQKLG